MGDVIRGVTVSIARGLPLRASLDAERKGEIDRIQVSLVQRANRRVQLQGLDVAGPLSSSHFKD
jgi:hypothetical protein